MGEDSISNKGRLVQDFGSDHQHGPGTPMMRAPFIGVTCFALAGMVVTATLMGKDVPQTGIEAYFINGGLVTEGDHSLDLSRPMFVRGQVPICPSEDALENYSPGDPGGCTTLSSSTPAGLVGIVTNGMRKPTFQMQLNTPNGTIRGWVDYENLSN